MTQQIEKTKPICVSCGYCDYLVFQGNVHYDTDLQRFVLTDTNTAAVYCGHCEFDTEIDWITYKDEEKKQ